MKQKKVILSAGGTGGHLFPAQALANALQNYDILFVAGGLTASPYFERTCYSYEEITCATFPLNRPWKGLVKGGKILQGVIQSHRILQRFCPDVVVGFGSFFTFPLLIATVLRGIPLILHEQNTIPGKVNRLFSRWAHINAITFPETARHLKGVVEQVSMPLRSCKNKEQKDPWEYFGLSAGRPTLLVFGGSKGAERLNHLVMECCRTLPGVQILHFTGEEKRALDAKECYQKARIPHCVKAFEPFMHDAFEIADLAITRAGAGTITELIQWEIPAILVPYPFSAEQHQVKNAEHFVQKLQGGVLLPEENLTASTLRYNVQDLLGKLEEIRGNIQKYKEAQSAHKHLADLVSLIS